jgi:hypothetical protein
MLLESAIKDLRASYKGGQNGAVQLAALVWMQLVFVKHSTLIVHQHRGLRGPDHEVGIQACR